jgi:hypothetical protein
MLMDKIRSGDFDDIKAAMLLEKKEVAVAAEGKE